MQIKIDGRIGIIRFKNAGEFLEFMNWYNHWDKFPLKVKSKSSKEWLRYDNVNATKVLITKTRATVRFYSDTDRLKFIKYWNANKKVKLILRADHDIIRYDDRPELERKLEA